MDERDPSTSGAAAIEATIDDAAPGDPSTAIAIGTEVGRYRIVGRIGAGSMGVVWLAHDPQLDRKVAIKLLYDDTPRARARLVREAQALARVNHPSVATIFDVGTHNERVWIAMELIEGETLTTWSAVPRRLPDVLAVLRRAGEGLAAAHAADVVHRDVKPDNVMVADGLARVVVTDFGLARVDEERDRETSASASMPLVGDELRTRPGALPGTPAFMAPERIAGAPADARSDQFSFCVMAWALLYGARPFGGGSPAAVAAAITKGDRASPPPDRAVPRWLHDVIVRGLAGDPESRWPGMTALVAALERGRRRRLGMRIAIGVGALASIAGANEAVRRLGHARALEGCDAEAHAIDAVWPGPDRERAIRLRDSMLAGGAAYAATTFDRVAAGLDLWTDEWRAVSAEQCRTIIDDGNTLDGTARETCLQDSRARLELVLELLGDTQGAPVQRAVATLSELARPEACLHARANSAVGSTVDPETDRALRRGVDRIALLRAASRFGAAREQAAVLVDEA